MSVAGMVVVIVVAIVFTGVGGGVMIDLLCVQILSLAYGQEALEYGQLTFKPNRNLIFTPESPSRFWFETNLSLWLEAHIYSRVAIQMPPSSESSSFFLATSTFLAFIIILCTQ